MTDFEPQYPTGRSAGIPAQPSGSSGYPPQTQGYQQSTYQQPGYQQGYQQPGYQRPDGAAQPEHRPPPYGPPPIRSTNTMAVLAIVFAFVFAPLGIVFGVIARRQIRRTGEDGSGLALAGIVLGVLFTVMFVIYAVVAVILIDSGLDDLFENLPDQQ